jgi:hypothetical protein
MLRLVQISGELTFELSCLHRAMILKGCSTRGKERVGDCTRYIRETAHPHSKDSRDVCLLVSTSFNDEAR